MPYLDNIVLIRTIFIFESFFKVQNHRYIRTFNFASSEHKKFFRNNY